jgi:hypothetical protein
MQTSSISSHTTHFSFFNLVFDLMPTSAFHLDLCFSLGVGYLPIAHLDL